MTERFYRRNGKAGARIDFLFRAQPLFACCLGVAVQIPAATHAASADRSGHAGYYAHIQAFTGDIVKKFLNQFSQSCRPLPKMFLEEI